MHHGLKKFGMLMAVLVVAACAPKAADVPATGTADDEAAIRAMGGKYADAMNKQDMAGLGAMLADDYEEVTPAGKHNVGPQAAMDQMKADMAMMPPMAGVTMSATTDFVKWIDANHAVAGGTWSYSGTLPAGMPARGSWVGVTVKKDSTWKMLSSLGSADMAPPTMPDHNAMPKKP